VDASRFGMGAVLSQEGEHTTPTLVKWLKPTLYPIAYYSATFTPTEWNYDIYEWELLAVMKSLHYWRPYLGWMKEPFTILTDHINLTYWKSPQNLNRCTTRWHANLQEYNFKIKHISDNTNIPTDTLSWPPSVDQGKNNNQSITMIPPSCVCTAITIAKPTNKFLQSIMLHTHNHVTAGHLGHDETIRKTKEIY